MTLANILWTVLVIVLVLWLLGFLLDFAGLAGSGIIHVLLVVAAIIVIYNLLVGRRTV